MSGLRLAGNSPISSPTTSRTGHNVQILDLTWDEEELKSTKRKRADQKTAPNPQQELVAERRLLASVIKTIKELDSTTREMNRTVRENTNTKRKIKEAIAKVRSLVSKIMTREVRELLGGTMGQKRKPEVTTKGTQTEHVEADDSQKQERENAILVEKNAKLKEEIRQLQNVKKTVLEEEMLRDTENYDQFMSLEEITWPKGVYKSAYIAACFPRTKSKDTDILVLHE